MKSKKLSLTQKIVAIVLGIITLLSAVICAWYVYVQFFGADKTITNTYEGGLQTIENGDQKYFVEIKYFTNKNHNGLECFEVKFNYLLDDNKTGFYSQGLQFITENPEDQLSFGYDYSASDVKGVWFHNKKDWYLGEDWYRFWCSYNVASGESYNYMSGDDYNTSLISTNPLSADSAFKIELGDQVFLMKFNGADTNPDTAELASIQESKYHFYLVYGVRDYNYYYVQDDPYSFSKLMFDAVQSIQPGTSRSAVFEFGNLFKYYKSTGTGTFESTIYPDMDLVSQELKSYYAIKIDVLEDGIQSSKESLFKRVRGSANYNSNGDYSDGTYMAGEEVLLVTQSDFVLVNVEDNIYALKLNDKFVSEYKPHAKNISLDIKIDIDWFKQKGYQFFGFTEDSGLDQFKVTSCKVRETVQGEVVEREVPYA